MKNRMSNYLEDVIATVHRLRPWLNVTPLRSYAALNEVIGNGIEIFIKHENHHPTGSFKVRNGLAAVIALTDDQLAPGLVVASMGNHGLGVAWAAAGRCCPITVFVPKNNSASKNKAIMSLGAELIECGDTYQDAVQAAKDYSRASGGTFIPGADNRWVLAGAGTVTLEIVQQDPSLDALIYAVGGGSQAAGGSAVLSQLAPQMEVYCVQAENAPAVYRRWQHGDTDGCRPLPTLADGLATNGTSKDILDMMRLMVRGFTLVSEDEIAAAMVLYLTVTHNIAEGAAAASLAALFKLRDRLAGKRVGLILSGSNVDIALLRKILIPDDCLTA